MDKNEKLVTKFIGGIVIALIKELEIFNNGLMSTL